MTTPARRVALITGAMGGLGSALVRAFAAEGWSVAAGWHHTAPDTLPKAAFATPLDVTRADAATAAVDAVLRRWGRLDVLVNNAGISRDELLVRTSSNDWDSVLAVNLKGAFHCCRAVLPAMVQQKEGHILNIVSFGGRVGRAGQTAYAASKAALAGLTRSLAREVGPSGIRVNAVSPGFLRTPMVGHLPPEQLRAHAAENVLGRLGDPDEAARCICQIAGFRDTSGQLFQLDSRIAP
ncbi:MAG: SDR family NAD(P)-dependent oxidoreductase [Verrucomicrobiae bacterium]|nr:SDR family NAD(P)-dependent oxidoreductase [Verrucomicrobiae bacterium]